MPTAPLAGPARSPLEIAPLARLHARELHLLGPEFPPAGELLLVLWRPGASPPFAFVEARVRREGARWRVDADGEGHVLLWGPRSAPVHRARG